MRRLATFTLCLFAFSQSLLLDAANDDSLDKETYEQRLSSLSQQLLQARKNASDKSRVLLQRTSEKEQAKLDLDRASSAAQIKRGSVTSLQNTNTSIANEITENKKRIVSQEGAAITLSSQISSLTAKEKQAVDDQAAIAEDADAAIKAVNTQQANVADINREISENQTRVTENDSSTSSQETLLAASQSELTDLEEQERQLLAEKDDVQLQQRNLRDVIEDIDRAFRSLQNQIDGNDTLVQKAQDQVQAKQDLVQSGERSLEEQKRKLGDASEKLSRETQKSAAITKALEELKKKQSAETTALKAADIENERLNESISLTTSEIASIDSQLESVKTQIADAQSKLKDATDKAPLEDRIKELRVKESELTASLKTQRESLAKDKAARTALIGKKAESKLRVLDIENQVGQKTDEQTVSQQAIGSASKDEQAAKVAIDASTRSLDKNKNDLANAKMEAERLYGIQDKLDERWQDLDGQQDLLAKKGPFIGTLLISINSSLRIVQDEALPKVRSSINSSKQALADLSSEHQQLLTDGRKLQREKTDAVSNLQEYQRQSALRTAELKAAERVLSDTKNSLAVSKQSLAGINSELASLRNSIADREASIGKNLAAIKVSIDDIAKLDAQVLAQTKVFNDAQAAETLARDIWEPLEQAAVAAAKATEDGKTLLANRISAYTKALADVVLKAGKDAQDAGATEGLAGEAPGAAAGALAGGSSWQQEGSSQLRAAEFSKAFEVARLSAVSSGVKADTHETVAQRSERAANASLQLAFDLGSKRGKSDGMKSGILLGDNADVEKRGYDAGYAAGKQRIETEMEQALRKASYKEREAEILKDDPPVTEPTREKRDATKEVTARFNAGARFEAIASKFLGVFEEAVAVAADGLGVLPASQVPKVTYSRRSYQDSGIKPYHADFPGAYRVAYDEAYEKAYIASYLESYRAKFVKAHGDAFAAAKAKALQDGFPDEVRKGTEAGAKEGLFEALGYNAGRDIGLSEGKKKGETTAFDRGKSSGDTQGYKDNQEPARLAAISNGRADCDSAYRNSVRIVSKPQTLTLVEETANKRLELNEKLSWGVTLRNFGGTRAEKGTVSVQVDTASLKGIKFDKNTVTLGAIDANSEVEFSNLLTGLVMADSQISFKAGVFYQSAKVGEFTFSQEIYAPFTVSFTDYYYPAKLMRVGDVGKGNGYLNAVRVKSLGDAKLLDDLRVAITLENTAIGKTSWYQTTGEFVTLDEKAADGSRARGFFLNAATSVGLGKNRIRVRLQNKAGQIVFDKIIDAPVEVRQ